MSVSLLAERYAAALAGAADSADSLEDVGRDLHVLDRSLAVSVELGHALGNPQVPDAAKVDILRALFREPPHEVTEAFIRLVAERRRAAYLTPIVAACLEAIEHRSGLRIAEVRTAMALSTAQQDALQAKLSAHAGTQVRLRVQLEPALVGGLVVRLDDTLFDGTVGAHLESLHRRLRGSSTTSAPA